MRAMEVIHAMVRQSPDAICPGCALRVCGSTAVNQRQVIVGSGDLVNGQRAGLHMGDRLDGALSEELGGVVLHQMFAPSTVSGMHHFRRSGSALPSAAASPTRGSQYARGCTAGHGAASVVAGGIATRPDSARLALRPLRLQSLALEVAGDVDGVGLARADADGEDDE